MYAKISGGTVIKFPYTFGDLRKDHPNVSFPKNITATIMQKYGMVGVLEGPKPTLGAYQTVQRNALPTRPVIGQYTEEDAPMPEMVGEDIIANYWMIEYTAVDMFSDTTDEKLVVDENGDAVLDADGNEQYETVVTTKAEHEAAYQAGLDDKAAEAVRKERDEKLAATDWRVIKAYETGSNIPAEWELYRQALRDITTQEGFPHTVTWPEEPVA